MQEAISDSTVLDDTALRGALAEVEASDDIRHSWTKEELQSIHDLPLPELLYRAHTLHRTYHDPLRVQRSTLLSVKTGGCPENCGYCPQSAHYQTGVERHPVLPLPVVLEKAAEAKAAGSTRFCMGAAWREVRDGPDFDKILDLVRGVHGLGLEVCCTLGMLNESQALRLKEAGCHAYNHNLDTSPEYYGEVISTRTYDDRLRTLNRVRKAGITVCCGGIVGMGETVSDRIGLLVELARQEPHPESVPLNLLVKVEGTPLASREDVDPIDFVRMVATARIAMPRAMVRLSAGRTTMSDELHALCFFAGANSLFAGDKLLTTANPGEDHDTTLMKRLGMTFFGSTQESCVEEQPRACAVG
jgi:biotin synthase